MKPTYMIIAGINGAGKSTLFQAYPTVFKNTKRINADEILQKNHGDWRRISDNLTAMRESIIQTKLAFKNRESLHVETTLAGNGRTQGDFIALAHHQGFRVSLWYVALRSPELAIKRVQLRASLGGHAVPEETIYRRYTQSLQNLIKISKLVDQVSIFDNSKIFQLVYARSDSKILSDDLQQYPYLPKTNQLF